MVKRATQKKSSEEPAPAPEASPKRSPLMGKTFRHQDGKTYKVTSHTLGVIYYRELVNGSCPGRFWTVSDKDVNEVVKKWL